MTNAAIEEILAEAEKRVAQSIERMRQAAPAVAIGAIESITGFGSDEEMSLSIELAPWRWQGREVESGALYIRKLNTTPGELRKLRQALPEGAVVAVTVRPDVSRRADGELWDALLDDGPIQRAEDEEVSHRYKRAHRQGQLFTFHRPQVDIRWMVINTIARLLPAPKLPLVHLEQVLPDGEWLPVLNPTLFDECEVFSRSDEHGSVVVGVMDGRVQGVQYDFDTYRASGAHRARKLQSILRFHSNEAGRVRRILDNRAGAMLYRTKTGSRYAVYAYNSDTFMIHTEQTALRRY